MATTRRSARTDAYSRAKTHGDLAEVADAMAARATRPCSGGLPAVVKFPAAAALSFCMASLGYSLVGELSNGGLASVSRSQDTWGEVTALAGWRTAELALAWVDRLDALDVAMLDLLSHGPWLFLLTAFYSLSPATAAAALVVDVLSAAVPFYLLRPLSDVHRGLVRVTNRELIDVPLQLYTTVLSTGIYTVVLVLSMRFVLPHILVVYFSGLASLEPAYAASYASVLPATLLFGAAANAFIFTPFATTGRSKDDDAASRFHAVTATLGETVRWNFWGYTAKTKVVIRRTAVAMFLTGVNTYLACTRTMYGVEGAGAASYAVVWVLATLCTGVGLGLVGGE